MTGTTLVSDYQLALRSVTYENTSHNPNTATRTVSFVITDDESASSDPWNRDINITAFNDPPAISVPGTQNISEDQTITFTFVSEQVLEKS